MALSGEDKLHIHDLMSRYCIAMDTDDRKAFMEMFEPDGEWIALTAQFTDRQHFQAYVDSPHSPLVGRHVVSAVRIEEDEGSIDSVNVRADVLYLRPGDDGEESARIDFIGGYRCVVRKVDGEWRFKYFGMPPDAVVYASPFFRSLQG